MILDPLQGKYHVMKRIGVGGFATIYSGFDMSLERCVAIKLLEPVEGAGDINTRFFREARAMANLSHPNIVAVFDSAEFDEKPYMVMDLVCGPTLIELVKTSSPTLPQVCSIAQQVCKGMKYGHDHGVVHGDLTLGNIMIHDTGIEQTVKVLDFGMAQLLHEEDSAADRIMAGTAYFMSPEQIRNDPIDGRTDIFSFGVCFHRMLNGFFPFEAEFPAAISYLIMNEDHVAYADHVPDPLRKVVSRCLEKEPEGRYQDFAEVERDIDAALAGGLAAAAPSETNIEGLRSYAKPLIAVNPYVSRVMVSNPDEFFGREREIGRIYSRLDAPRPQSVSVVGDRRIGKSSLLYHIYDVANRQRHMSTHGDSIFVYLDFQQNREFDETRFIDFLFNMFNYEDPTLQDFSGRERTLDELKTVVEQLHNAGKRIVILMDEFEVITANPKFSGKFFALLRGLANTYSVAYVTSSNEDLQKMCHNKDISDSPFFNIFTNLILRPLAEKEAVEMVTEPSEARGVPLAPHAGRILEMAGLFPLFLQMACSAAFESQMDDPSAEPDWPEINDAFMEEARPHYRSVWNHFDDQAKEALTLVARGKSVGSKYEYIKDRLARRGYVVDSNGGSALCSTSFESFVMAETGASKGGGFFKSLLRKKG